MIASPNDRRKITRYEIVMGEWITKVDPGVDDIVTSMLKDGWYLYGYPYYDVTLKMHCQAMVTYEE